MSKQRPILEKKIQADIEAALGAEPDLILLRNAVGDAVYHNDDGKMRRLKYGLLVGSPDLVGILAPRGRWFCLEVKAEGGALSPDQIRVHAIWKAMGALIYVVHSVVEAKMALATARLVVEMEMGGAQWWQESAE